MPRKITAAVLILAAALAALAAADVMTEYGLDRGRWSDSLFVRIVEGACSPPRVPVKLRSVQPADRAAVVSALGAFAKSYVDSEAFRTRYDGEWKSSQPPEPPAPKTGKQVVAERKAELKKAIADTENSLPNLPIEMRPSMRESIEQLRSSMKDLDGLEHVYGEQEKARYDADMAAYKRKLSDPNAMPRDPRVALKRALQKFLDGTAGVDYSATLVTRNDRQFFADKDLEKRPPEWKMCFRAGREACEAARAFATSWLKDLS
jgi:hypothetical protein